MAAETTTINFFDQVGDKFQCQINSTPIYYELLLHSNTKKLESKAINRQTILLEHLQPKTDESAALESVSRRTVNRLCSSGLQAVADVAVAAAIKVGFYDIGIGAGAECMTVDKIRLLNRRNPKVDSFHFQQARDCLLHMGISSENIAQRYDVSKEEQDQAAVECHRRAAAATASGKFKDEFIPVFTKTIDQKSGVDKSDCICGRRHSSTHKPDIFGKAEASIQERWLHNCRECLSN